MLILCGSLVGMMYRTTLAYDSPLYGRRTGQWALQPLAFWDIQQLLPNFSQVDLVLVKDARASEKELTEDLLELTRSGKWPRLVAMVAKRSRRRTSTGWPGRACASITPTPAPRSARRHGPV